MFDPIVWAEELGVTVSYERLPGALHGFADPAAGHVILDARLTAREARCALTHELVHIKRGDQGPQTAKIERKVRRDTAIMLLPDVQVIRGAAHLPWADAAEALHVTEPVLEDRIRAMRPFERDEVRCLHALYAVEVSA